jgi:hypothetical protein
MVTVTPVEADLPTAVGVPLVAVADVPSAAAGVPLVVVEADVPSAAVAGVPLVVADEPSAVVEVGVPSVAADMPSAAVAMVAVDTPVEAVTAADMVDTGN